MMPSTMDIPAAMKNSTIPKGDAVEEVREEEVHYPYAFLNKSVRSWSPS